MTSSARSHGVRVRLGQLDTVRARVRAHRGPAGAPTPASDRTPSRRGPPRADPRRGCVRPRRSRSGDVHQSTYLRPAAASASRILYMSSPSTPEASLARFSHFGRFARRGGGQRGGGQGARHTHHPVVVGDDHVAGVTSAPAQTTGMLTEPSVALTVPLALIARLHTGKAISVSAFTSRQPASMISARRAARLERRGEQLAEKPVGALGRDRRDHDVARAGSARPPRATSSCLPVAAARSRPSLTPARRRRWDAGWASSGRPGPSPRAPWRCRTPPSPSATSASARSMLR